MRAVLETSRRPVLDTSRRQGLGDDPSARPRYDLIRRVGDTSGRVGGETWRRAGDKGLGRAHHDTCGTASYEETQVGPGMSRRRGRLTSQQ